MFKVNSEKEATNKYVIIWNDDYPSCFFSTLESAREFLDGVEETGKIITRKEYLEK